MPAAKPRPESPPSAAGGHPAASKSAPIVRQVLSEPLTALDDSDGEIHAGLAEAVDADALDLLFFPDQWIRRFVVTIDRLPRKKLPYKLVATRPLGDEFLTIGDNDTLMIDPANTLRYRIFVNLVESIDTATLVALYRRYYPLFQTAYEDLGNLSEAFDDRLVDVIDHLLAAPQIKGRIRLVPDRVLYKFADPELEALSSGHKLMIRLGSDNARRIKTKLLELRTALVGADAS
jgi:hypothetical protein